MSEAEKYDARKQAKINVIEYLLFPVTVSQRLALAA
jgi:hypothetical protein